MKNANSSAMCHPRSPGLAISTVFALGCAVLVALVASAIFLLAARPQRPAFGAEQIGAMTALCERLGARSIIETAAFREKVVSVSCETHMPSTEGPTP